MDRKNQEGRRNRPVRETRKTRRRIARGGNRDLERRIAEGQAAKEKWQERFSRGAPIDGGPFAVGVSLLEADPAWAEVTVRYRYRFGTGVSARCRMPVVAVIKAGELARELSELPGAGGDPRMTRYVPPLDD